MVELVPDRRVVRKIEHTSQGRDMTLEELAAFVQEAMRQDVQPTATVRTRTGWGGRLRSVSAERWDIRKPSTWKADEQ